MSIRKTHSHSREPLHVRCSDLNLVRVPCEILIGARVPHPHVIGHHQNDIRFLDRLDGDSDKEQTNQGESGNSEHSKSMNP